MSERVAIVAGARGELGRATAAKLAAAGYAVTGIDRNEQGLKELPDGIGREVADPADPAGRVAPGRPPRPPGRPGSTAAGTPPSAASTPSSESVTGPRPCSAPGNCGCWRRPAGRASPAVA